jgi:hypothetical protein
LYEDVRHVHKQTVNKTCSETDGHCFKPLVKTKNEENSGLLGCDSVAMGEWFPTFQTINAFIFNGQAVRNK